MKTSRYSRQLDVASWCARAFSAEHASSVPQRAVRLLEETVEAYQAAGGTPEMAHKLIDFVFARPSGELAQELGGVGVTVLALANAAGLDADAEERREVKRILAKPVEEFAERNAKKDAAGFKVDSVVPFFFTESGVADDHTIAIMILETVRLTNHEEEARWAELVVGCCHEWGDYYGPATSPQHARVIAHRYLDRQGGNSEHLRAALAKYGKPR